ncbi:MAG: hypothetical protein U0271_30520 [Polyangiaceae bacterium]
MAEGDPKQEASAGGGEPSPPDRGPLEQVLSVFADVRRGEGPTVLLLTLGLFLLLSAYYVIKPVRDSLITGVPGGAEYKSYMGAAIAVALLFAVPAYARFAARLPRSRLLLTVTAFFVANLVAFYLAGLLPGAASGRGGLAFALGFYLWAGIFNMMVVAQYWAFANDLYTEEQGKRVFPLIGIGASVGSAVGSLLLDKLVRRYGTITMLLVAAVVLGASGAVAVLVSTRAPARASTPTKPKSTQPAEDDSQGAFAMVRSHRYLMLLAAFSVVFTLVNTNAEYVKDVLIKAAAAAAGQEQGLSAAAVKDLRTQLFNEFYLYVNVLGAILQSFVVSRVVKFLGLRRGFFILPVVALLDATTIALLPVWGVVRFGKIAENAVDYSLNNTLRNVLWLPTTRRMKYVAKQAVDTFFVRAGDVLSAILVFVLADRLSLSVRVFAVINVVLVVGWLWLARRIVAENEALSTSQGAPEPGSKIS